MTTTATDVLPIATLPEVRQLIESASRKGRQDGVIGVRARLQWSGAQELTHDGTEVRVRLCGSALAVRAALQERAEGRWLVIVTDRDEEDLGTGILAHLHGQRLRSPRPWAAVGEQFAADRIDTRLVKHPQARDLAAGLLAARGDRSWLPARGGLLTYDHAFGSVAGRWFELAHATDPVVEDVMRWSARSGQDALVTDLRATAGDVVADATLGWLASRCGRASDVVASLVDAGRVADLVPLGIAARAVLECPAGSEPWVLMRVQQLQVEDVDARQLSPLADAAERVVRDWILDDTDASRREVGRLLTRADTLVRELRAEGGVPSSDLLPSSLTTRLADLGEALGRAVHGADQRARATTVDVPLADPDRLGRVEEALTRVQAHLLARRDEERRVPRALAAVRLTRWLAQDLASHPDGTAGLPGRLRRHRDFDAWVDRAYDDAWRGVDDETLARGLRAVVQAVRLRRDAHDRDFAAALAAATEAPEALPPDLTLLEDLVPRVVAPLAKSTSVLLVVADGMSAAVATEIVDSIETGYDSWGECLPAGQHQRSAAVAVLPSLTEVSRCSLLSGTLTTGQQQAERTNFPALTQAHGLTSALFHKLHLDSSGAGRELAPDVASAIDDVEGTQVVACVLNTIDDALDRSDPGIEWTEDTVKHLRPLLQRARRAGRTVVLTSDHGHIVERREGHQRSGTATSSNRSRPFDGSDIGDGEVRVRGPRVLLHDGDAVLAVDERLRYGPLKAGYHGGAAPAEVVVPIHVLTPGQPPAGWDLAVPQTPTWWHTPIPRVDDPASPGPATRTVLPEADSPTLFDEVTSEPTPASGKPDLAAQVLASATYAAQRERAQRVRLDDHRIETLLRLLVAAPGHRLDAASAATALGVPRQQLSGALPMVQRLLNVEQYAVLDRDPDGSTIVLDVDLLAEQFGVAR